MSTENKIPAPTSKGSKKEYRLSEPHPYPRTRLGYALTGVMLANASKRLDNLIYFEGPKEQGVSHQ